MSSWSEMGGRDDTPRGHATYMGGISGTQSLLLIFLKIALRAPQFASPAGQWTSPPLTPTVPILPGALCLLLQALGVGRTRAHSPWSSILLVLPRHPALHTIPPPPHPGSGLSTHRSAQATEGGPREQV